MVPVFVPVDGIVTEPVAFPDEDVITRATAVPGDIAGMDTFMYDPGLIDVSVCPFMVTVAPDTAEPDDEPVTIATTPIVSVELLATLATIYRLPAGVGVKVGLVHTGSLKSLLLHPKTANNTNVTAKML